MVFLFAMKNHGKYIMINSTQSLKTIPPGIKILLNYFASERIRVHNQNGWEIINTRQQQYHSDEKQMQERSHLRDTVHFSISGLRTKIQRINLTQPKITRQLPMSLTMSLNILQHSREWFRTAIHHTLSYSLLFIWNVLRGTKKNIMFFPQNSFQLFTKDISIYLLYALFHTRHVYKTTDFYFHICPQWTDLSEPYGALSYVVSRTFITGSLRYEWCAGGVSLSHCLVRLVEV